MKKLFEIYSKYKRIINYLITGVMTTVINIIVFYICTKFFLDGNNSIELQIANIISWFLAVVFAYITNRKFVFNSENKNIIKEILSFFSARLVTLFVDMFIMFLFVTCFSLNYNIIKIVSNIIIIVLNYIISKIFVFRK